MLSPTNQQNPLPGKIIFPDLCIPQTEPDGWKREYLLNDS